MSFLTAQWRRLAFANYEIDPKILASYLPYKTELDSYQGKYFVSLVGFMFQNVKLLGITPPGHANFEEVNLRFYVRYKNGNEWRRGVVFVKEIVPKPAISFIANTVYNEAYETRKMKHIWEEKANDLRTAYKWKNKKEWFSFEVVSEKDPIVITPNTEEEFITEHYWGYNKISSAKTTAYQVTHPKWDVYKIIRYNIDANFEKEYGEAFKFLNKAEPVSVMLAEGSAITIESKQTIK